MVTRSQPGATASPVLKAVVVGAAVGGGTAVVAGAAVSTVAAYFARRVVTPDRVKPDDATVISVGAGTATLAATPETVSPGRYGLWLERGAGHVRLGQVVEKDVRARTVTRQVEQIDYGKLVVGPARWNKYYFAGTPTSALGIAHDDISISSDAGQLPTWFVRPSKEVARRDVWAILVHGRGATREECLRAVPVLHRLGMPVLVPTYRNDVDGPATTTGRLSLGDAEWQDVEAAILHALDAGARDVVLFGWSMGGAIVLQHVSRSWTADRVRALVLDSPVIDWRDVLEHNAELAKLPRAVSELGLWMLADKAWRRVVGTDGPVDLRRLDWVTRAAELRLPILLLHSDDDEFVPSGPSRRLAQARPDLVTFESFPHARHCREWNTDPQRWEREVARFLLRHL
ncbi:MAG: alpha/beta hydrolase family protein [Actinomycetales bacterium]